MGLTAISKSLERLILKQFFASGDELCQILTLKEWNEIDPQISIEFVCENKFVENMNLNDLAKRMEIYSSIQANEGKVLPVKETLKRVFGYTESDIEKILAEIEKEKKDPKLKDFYNSDSGM